MSILAEHMHSARFTPKYVVLARDLLRDIAVRQLREGDLLGTEHELVQRYSLSRVTVRQALEVLENEGYVSRKRARGTFVKRQVNTAEQFGMIRGTVLVVCSNEQNAHREEDTAFATVLFAIEQKLADQGFTVQIATIGRKLDEDRARLEALMAGQSIEGVLVIGVSQQLFAGLFADKPVIATGTFHPETDLWVGQDISQAIGASVTHLIEHGHTDIAMICGPWVDGPALALFAKGYQAAHESAGLPGDRRRLLQAYPGESLEERTLRLLDAAPRPTAIVCENWLICRAVIVAAEQLGLEIPRDISVIGYGQNVLEINDPVPISAYVSRTAEVGEAAAAMLVDALTGQINAPQRQAIPGRIEQRGSVRDLTGSRA